MEKYIIKNFARPSQTVINEYRQLDVSTIYEAQGKQNLLDYCLKPILSNVMIAGPAVTVTCQAGDNLMIHAAIEVCKPGDIVVITAQGTCIAGMIGELIVTALMKKGVQGVIIDSGIRDVQQIRDMRFPIWTRKVTSQGTTKIKGGWVNALATCGGVTVEAGDLIAADDDGVVVVKQEDLQSTLDSAKARLQKEKETRAKIASGQISLDFYNLRPVLDEEGVVYYENQEDYKKKREGFYGKT